MLLGREHRDRTFERKNGSGSKSIIEKFYALIKGEEVDGEDELEEAAVYRGVSQFPARVKCAALPWKALEQILDGEENER